MTPQILAAITIGFIIGCLVTWLIFARYRAMILRHRQLARISEKFAQTRVTILTAQLKHHSEKLRRAEANLAMARATIEAYSKFGHGENCVHWNELGDGAVSVTELPKSTD